MTERPVPRGLATLALVLLAASVTSHGLSSGTGQAMIAPGSILVLDAFAFLAALAALASRELSGEPGLSVERPVLATLGVFLALAFVHAFHGPQKASGFGTACSWASLAFAGLAARDLARRRGVARPIVALVVGVAVAASALALHRLWFESQEVLDLIKNGQDEAVRALSEAQRRELLYRAADPMAIGPFVLPSHLATCAGMALPLAIAVGLVAWRRAPGPGRTLALAVVGQVILVLALGLFFARSKGATLATGLALATFAFFAIPRERAVLRRRLLLGSAGVLVLVLLGGAVRYALRPNAFGVGLSVQVRLEYWRAAARSIAEKPFAGHGLESFQTELPRHKDARAEEARHAHDDPLELAVEMGVLGPLAFLALVLALARAGVVAMRATAPTDAGPARPLALPPFGAVTLGAGLGVLALFAHGDVYDAQRPAHLIVAGLIAVAIARAVVFALGENDAAGEASARLIAGAMLAGALAFVLDGLTDFPLRVHALVGVAFLLALLAPAVVRPDEAPPPQGRPVRAALAFAVSALVLVGFVNVRRLTAEDGVRGDALDKIVQAEGLLFPRGRRRTREEDDLARKLLDEATLRLRQLLESDALPPQDVLSLVHGEQLLGRDEHDSQRKDLILRVLEDATKKHPESSHLWSEYGSWLARMHALEAAIDCYDRAARLYPTNPRRRLDAGTARAELFFAKQHAFTDQLRKDAIRELGAALACARTSRLERLRLSDEETLLANSLLVSLGGAPRAGGEEEPAPPR